MPSREAAQLKVSGLGSHVAVKRAREWRGEEADWLAARDFGKTNSRERDKGRRMCAPYGDAGVPAGHMEERTCAVSVDSVCKGGTVCACSDRTDAR